MNAKFAASVAIVVAIIGLAVYWYVSRPTPEEKTLKEFFSDFREGDYSAAQALTVGNDFYKMASSTSVRDTDGKKYLIGDYLPASVSWALQSAVETYIKPHLVKWDYLSMDTQRIEPGSSAVTFRVDLAVKDYTTGNAFGTNHNGRIEGVAHMKFEGDRWFLEKLEINLFSDDGLMLAPYLQQTTHLSSF
jgi:hypothetical protein